MRRDRLESALSIGLTVAAIIMAASVAHREFSDRVSLSTPDRSEDDNPTYVAEWESMLPYGNRVGDASARAKLIEFFDLECPACRRFHREIVDSARHEFGSDLSVTFVHFPLSFHRFAQISARASECAAQESRFSQFVDRVYAFQDSLGLKSWGSFAADAGIRDTTRFVACVRAVTPAARVDSGVALAQRLNVTATPTVLLNGWRFSQPPSLRVLSRWIRNVIDGKQP